MVEIRNIIPQIKYFNGKPIKNNIDINNANSITDVAKSGCIATRANIGLHIKNNNTIFLNCFIFFEFTLLK